MKSSIINLVFFYFLVSSVICDSQASKLFWVDQSNGKIQSANLDGSHVTDIKDSLQMAEGIALDTVSDPMKIYFSEAGLNRIVRMNFDGSNPEEVITGITGLEDIALDLENRKIYWLKNTYSDDRVQRADMDSLNSNIQDLYTSTYAMHDYRGIDVHVDSQLVYWTQTVYGRVDRISRMNCDGSGRTVIGNYLGPRDLDVLDNTLYWIWGSGDNITRSNLDGSPIDTLISGVDAFYLALSKELNKMYWTEYGMIRCTDMDTIQIVDLVTRLGHSIKGIALYYDPDAVSVDEITKIPVKFELGQNYPNPFNPSTTIQFQIPKSQFVTLKVFNILGKEVSTLVSKKLNPGNHTYTFNSKNLASGIYYYQLVAGEYREVKKMILLR